MPVASCHCGAVRVEVDHRPATLTSCNCSVCRRYGALWGYYTSRAVRIGAAPDTLVAYAWGDRSLEFLHCRGCGCALLWHSRSDHGDDIRIGLNAWARSPACPSATSTVPTRGPISTRRGSSARTLSGSATRRW
jgi:hypothetical protein